MAAGVLLFHCHTTGYPHHPCPSSSCPLSPSLSSPCLSSLLLLLLLLVMVVAGLWWMWMWLLLIERKKCGSGLGLFWVTWPGPRDCGYFIPYCLKSFVGKWLNGYVHHY